jgi:hypothetical protein
LRTLLNTAASSMPALHSTAWPATYCCMSDTFRRLTGSNC